MNTIPEITNAKLAAVMANILTNPFSGHLNSTEDFEQFCTAIAQVICNYCGGDVVEPAKYMPQEDSMQWGSHYQLAVGSNDFPASLDVWKAPPIVVVPASVFSSLLSMATQHVSTFEKDVHDSPYDKAEYAELSAKKAVLEQAKPIILNYHSTQLPLQDSETTMHESPSVPVKHWDTYGDINRAMSHQCEIEDRRKAAGQLFIDLSAIEAGDDAHLGVLFEVNTNPLDAEENVPCAHVHFNDDALAVSLFKIGKHILMRPENQVGIERFVHQNGNVQDAMFWITP